MEKVVMPQGSMHTVTVEDATFKLLLTAAAEAPQIPALLLHTHGYTELFVCMSGELEIAFADGSVTLTAGEAIMVPANLPHSRVLRDNACTWSSIGILLTRHSGRMQQNLYRLLEKLCCAPFVRVFTNVHTLCANVMALNPSDQPEYFPAIKTVTMMIELAQKSLPRHREAFSIPHTAGELSRVSQLELILDREYNRMLTAEEIAARLFVSQRQLARIVMRRYGTTLHQLILQRRIEAAARLLREGNATVNDIALQVGFGSKACFYRAFREQFGMTPSEYRIAKMQEG